MFWGILFVTSWHRQSLLTFITHISSSFACRIALRPLCYSVYPVPGDSGDWGDARQKRRMRNLETAYIAGTCASRVDMFPVPRRITADLFCQYLCKHSEYLTLSHARSIQPLCTRHQIASVGSLFVEPVAVVISTEFVFKLSICCGVTDYRSLTTVPVVVRLSALFFPLQ